MDRWKDIITNLDIHNYNATFSNTGQGSKHTSLQYFKVNLQSQIDRRADGPMGKHAHNRVGIYCYFIIYYERYIAYLATCTITDEQIDRLTDG